MKNSQKCIWKCHLENDVIFLCLKVLMGWSFRKWAQTSNIFQKPLFCKSLPFGNQLRNENTVRCQYNQVYFLLNHKRHTIARLLGWEMGCLMNLHSYSALVITGMCTTLCYIGPRHKGTRLYMQLQWNDCYHLFHADSSLAINWWNSVGKMG